MPTEKEELQTTWFPFNYLMAVVDDTSEAEKAVQELRGAGFHAEDIQLMRGAEAAERLDVTCQHCNLIKRLARYVWGFITVEGMVLSDYAREGKAGHQVLGVHLHRPEDAEKAQAILKAHQARHIEHFGHAGGMEEVTTY